MNNDLEALFKRFDRGQEDLEAVMKRFNKKQFKEVRDSYRRLLSRALERLAHCCLAPEPQAKGSTDFHEAMRQFTLWPAETELKQIKGWVLALAMDQRKKPSWRPWKAFVLVNRRNKALYLIKQIDELVARARERFAEADFSDLRKESAALVFWLLEIGHPKASELKKFNDVATLGALHRKETKIQGEREGKSRKFQQSKKSVKKSKEDIEDDQLMELVRRGDEKAWETLRKRHQRLVEWKVKEIVRRNSAVDDIVQSVFIQAWKEADKYVPNPTAKFTSWLTEIAKNRSLNEKKRAEREKKRVEFAHVSETGSKGRKKSGIGGSTEFSGWSGEDSDEADEPTYIAEDDNTEAVVATDGFDGVDSEADGAAPAVGEALSQLSPLQRRIVALLFPLDGSKPKTPQAVASKEGITVGRVEELKGEALRKMGQFMSH